jgi:hypothetical protein
MRKLSRTVFEVRHGIALVINRAVRSDDGWWWGNAEEQNGPFASSDEAVADASRDMGKFKLLRWDIAAIRSNKLFPLSGHIVVFDTGGRLLVTKGDRPAREGWALKQ